MFGTFSTEHPSRQNLPNAYFPEDTKSLPIINLKFEMSKQKLFLSCFSGTLMCLATLVGCGSSDFPLAKVTGKVLCEGQPVDGCTVYFEPLRVGGENVSAIVGQPGFAYTNADGTFIISTSEVGAEDGAVVGMHRVRVGAGAAKCNCSMDDEFTLMEVEVKADGNNDFEIVLPTRTRQDDAREKMDAMFDAPEGDE